MKVKSIGCLQFLIWCS